MKEKWNKVEQYVRLATCEACGTELIETGEATITLPPRYLYRCLQCDAEYWLDQHYPSIEHEWTTEVERR
jgi:uncharacterized protein with PIN domain